MLHRRASGVRNVGTAPVHSDHRQPVGHVRRISEYSGDRAAVFPQVDLQSNATCGPPMVSFMTVPWAPVNQTILGLPTRGSPAVVARPGAPTCLSTDSCFVSRFSPGWRVGCWNWALDDRVTTEALLTRMLDYHRWTVDVTELRVVEVPEPVGLLLLLPAPLCTRRLEGPKICPRTCAAQRRRAIIAIRVTRREVIGCTRSYNRAESSIEQRRMPR